ncbi:MAG TPA: hypothetical protein VGS01_16430 [Candidatus Limnocylindria bacterium]|jgi:hypothetical protein|nr:hypothetical protein [Candidatus Limnocylindria bacterium]
MELAAFASFAVLVVAWLIAPTKAEVVHIESVTKAAQAEAA